MTAGRQQRAPREADEGVVLVTDNPRASRFELRVNGVLAGYVSYRDARSGRAFEHTVIATEYQGIGLASQLIRSALDEARATGRNVLPFCPFVRSFIQQHPAYLDLVGQPERFGITVQTPDSR
jgi:predicted GNAT family acetyltransferase